MSSPKNERAREQEKRLKAIEAQNAAMRAYQRKQMAFGIGGAAVVVAIIVAIVIAGVRSRSKDEVATGQASTTTSSTVPDGEQPPTNTAPPISVAKALPGQKITGDTPCPKLDGSELRVTTFEKPPPMCMDPRQSYDVVIHTTKGDIKTQIGNPDAPEIVNNFITLAAYHYYDGAPIDFVMERGWWEAGDYIEEHEGISSPGYTVPYTGPEQIMTSVVVAMKLEPGTKDVAGRLVIGFGEQTASLPGGTPSIGVVLDGVEPSLAIGKGGTASGAVTEANSITGMTITLSDLIEPNGTTTTSVPGATDTSDTTATTAAPTP